MQTTIPPLSPALSRTRERGALRPHFSFAPAIKNGSRQASVRLSSFLAGAASLRRAALPIAFAASLCLHLAAFTLLSGSAHPNTSFSGKMTSAISTRLTVKITAPETSSPPPAIPPSNITSTAPLNREPSSAIPSPANGLLHSPVVVFHEHYFSASELDVIPTIRQDIDLYPEELQQFKQGGKIILSLWIDETGRVEKVGQASSNLPAIFSDVATQRFMQASFLPGIKNDLAVKSRVEAVLVFPSREMGG